MLFRSAGALNAGQHDHAQAYDASDDDVETLKTWLPTQDERTRVAHRSSEVRPQPPTIPIDQSFTVGGAKMSRPLDPNGGAGNVINCRCTLTYTIREI